MAGDTHVAISTTAGYTAGMTETQTSCPACGDTGYVPPFMDPCDCPAGLTGKPAGPTVGTRIVEVDTVKVWTGSEWKEVPTEEHSLDATPPGFPPLTSAPPFVTTTAVIRETVAAASSGDADMDELLGQADDWWEEQRAAEDVEAADAEWTDEDIDAEFDATVEAANDAYERDAAIAAVPKTSKETFADLEAACDSVPAAATPAAAGWSGGKGKPMTESQKSLVAKLIAERDPANPVVAALAAAAAEPITAKRASSLIDSLMAIPADPARKAPRPNNYAGPCQDCGGMVDEKAGVIRQIDGRWRTFHKPGECLAPEAKAALFADRVTEPGLYKHLTVGPDGPTDLQVKVYRVRKSRTSKRLYGELIVPPERAGDEVGFVYNGKAMGFLRASDQLSWAEAREFGAAYGACVACGRTLSDARSLVQGYGPTCAGHYRWPTVTAKQAEAIIAGTLTWDDVVGTTI